MKATELQEVEDWNLSNEEQQEMEEAGLGREEGELVDLLSIRKQLANFTFDNDNRVLWATYTAKEAAYNDDDASSSSHRVQR